MNEFDKAHMMDCINIRIERMNKNEQFWLTAVAKLLVAQHLGANIGRQLNKYRKLIVANDSARADLKAIYKFLADGCYLPFDPSED